MSPLAALILYAHASAVVFAQAAGPGGGMIRPPARRSCSPIRVGEAVDYKRASCHLLPPPRGFLRRRQQVFLRRKSEAGGTL